MVSLSLCNIKIAHQKYYNTFIRLYQYIPDTLLVNYIMSNASNNENVGITSNEFAEVIEVSNVETVPEYERVIHKEVFVRIMEEDLLRDVPVNRQSSKYIQEKIRRKAESLFILKTEGDKVLSRDAMGITDYRPLSDALDQFDFDKVPWIKPIVVDEHLVYALSCNTSSAKKEEIEDEEEDDDEEQEIIDTELPIGDVLANQIEQMKELREWENKLKKGETNFVTYMTALAKIQRPYVDPTNEELSKWGNLPAFHRTKLKNYASVMRYFGLRQSYRQKERVAQGPWCIPIYTQKKKTRAITLEVEIEEEEKPKYLTAISGESISVVGFLILPITHPGKEDYRQHITEAIKNEIRIPLQNPTIKQIDPRKPTMLLMETTPETTEISYAVFREIMKHLVPSQEQATNLTLEETKSFLFFDLQEEFKKWGYLPGTIHADYWKKIREKAADFAEKYKIVERSGINPELIRTLCSITFPDSLVRDDIYKSKFLKNIYRGSLGYLDISKYDYRGPDCNLHRDIRLKESLDEGRFFKTYSYQKIESVPREKEIARLKTLQNLLSQQQKTVSKEATSANDTKEENLSLDFSNTNKEVVRLQEKFKKELAIPEKAAKARKNLIKIEKQIEDLQKAQKSLQTKRNILKEASLQTAKQLFRDYLRDTVEARDVSRLTPAELGLLWYEADTNRDVERPKFTPLLETLPEIETILTEINKLSSDDEKRETIYAIIRWDGMLVDRYVYSIRFGAPLICGHWYYQRLVDDSSTNESRQRWVSEMITRFGDNGKAEKDRESCVICGANISRVNFTDNSYISEWGKPILMENVYLSEQRTQTYQRSLPPSPDKLMGKGVRDCQSVLFKNEMASKNITGDDLKAATQACILLDALTLKLDIALPGHHFLGLIYAIVQDNRTIIKYHAFSLQKRKEYMIAKRLTEKDMLRLEQKPKFIETIAKAYAAHIAVRFGTLVTAHLLWHLRTVTPPLMMGPKAFTGCSFFGFEGEEGFNYFLCLLTEMKAIRARFTFSGKSYDKPVRYKDIVDNFRYWIRSLKSSYQQALERRKTFEKDFLLFEQRKGSRRTDRNDEVSIDWSKQDIESLPKDLEDAIRKTWNRGDYNAFKDLQQRYLLQSKKVAHQLRHALNKVVKITPEVDVPKIEETCCVRLAKENEPFLDFFYRQDPKIKELIVEMETLREPEMLIKMRYQPTTFQIREKSTPMYRDQLGAFIIKNAPESLIQEKFIHFCHTTESAGERHEMTGIDFPSITQCIKCSWFLKDLEKKKFSREEYEKLIQNIIKRNTKILPDVKPWVQPLPITTLKREAHKNMKKEIHKLLTSLGKVLKKKGSESSKTGERKYEKILKDMDKFNNFFPTPDYEMSPQESIELYRKRSHFAVQKMKNYINDFLRTNISRIKSGYKIVARDIPWVGSAQEEEELQKALTQEKQWLEVFLTPSNKKLFSKLKFHYSYKDIENLNGVSPIYDKSWKWIERRSYFTPIEAVSVLKYYFISQLNLFLEVSGAGEPIVAEFIIQILNQIEKDRQVADLGKKDIQKWEDTMREKRMVQRLRYFEAIAEEDSLLFNAPYKKITDQIYEVDLPSKYDEFTFEKTEYEKEAEQADKESFLESQAKDIYGDGASEEQIASFVANQEEEDEIQKDIDEEIYSDEPGLKEGPEIMEVGYNYGDMPQGIENEGDGVNDYTQTEIWEPVSGI